MEDNEHNEEEARRDQDRQDALGEIMASNIDASRPAGSASTSASATSAREDRIRRKVAESMIQGSGSATASLRGAVSDPPNVTSRDNRIRRKVAESMIQGSGSADASLRGAVSDPPNVTSREDRIRRKVAESMIQGSGSATASLRGAVSDPPSMKSPGYDRIRRKVAESMIQDSDSAAASLYGAVSDPPNVTSREGVGPNAEARIITTSTLDTSNAGENEYNGIDNNTDYEGDPILTAEVTPASEDTQVVYHNHVYDQEHDLYAIHGRAAVVPNNDEVLVSGIVIDEAIEAQELEIKNKLAIKRIVCYSAVIFILISAVFVPVGILLRKNKGTKAPTASPSAYPSSIPSLAPSSIRFTTIADKLSSVSDPVMFESKSSPQYQALSWLADEDNTDIDASNLVQRYVLAVFYFTMNGPNWTLCSKGSNCVCTSIETIPCSKSKDYTDYLNARHECDWLLHKCDSSNEITEMFFNMQVRDDKKHNINMRGQLPSEMQHLTKLKYLHMDRNDISGSIPDFLGNMTSLKSIMFSYNHFTGTIPDSIFNLDQLIQFSANDNKLTGVLSPKVGNLTSLKNLKIQNNKLEGTVPLEMSNLPNLKILNIGENDMDGSIPDALCSMKERNSLQIIVDCEEIDCDCCLSCW